MIYSRIPVRAALQVVADATAVFLIWFTVKLVLALREQILELLTIGERVEQSGESSKDSIVSLGETLAGIPLIGDALSQPFGSAADAAESVAAAGVELQERIAAFADVVAWAVGAPTVALIVLLWLVPRLRFVMRAVNARRLLQSQAGRDLLALRALTTLNPAVVLKAVPDAAHAWRSGDRDAIAALSDLGARHAGLKGRTKTSPTRSRASRTP